MEKKFAKILAELMQKKGFKQLTLAKKLGIRQSQVSNWLNEKSLPGYYSIIMLCKTLGVSADYLLGLEL